MPETNWALIESRRRKRISPPAPEKRDFDGSARGSLPAVFAKAREARQLSIDKTGEHGFGTDHPSRRKILCGFISWTRIGSPPTSEHEEQDPALAGQHRNPASPSDSHENAGDERQELLPKHNPGEGSRGFQEEREKGRVEPITAIGLLKAKTTQPGTSGGVAGSHWYRSQRWELTARRGARSKMQSTNPAVRALQTRRKRGLARGQRRDPRRRTVYPSFSSKDECPFLMRS